MHDVEWPFRTFTIWWSNSSLYVRCTVNYPVRWLVGSSKSSKLEVQITILNKPPAILPEISASAKEASNVSNCAEPTTADLATAIIRLKQQLSSTNVWNYNREGWRYAQPEIDTFSWPNPIRPTSSWTNRPTKPTATVTPTDLLYAYSLITFAPVTDCFKIKHFIHECSICTENKKAI